MTDVSVEGLRALEEATKKTDPETRGKVGFYEVDLRSGNRVAVGKFTHSQHYCLKFTRDGVETRIALSPEAMDAVVGLYQHANSVQALQEKVTNSAKLYWAVVENEDVGNATQVPVETPVQS